jgi:hypothetical protein
MFQTETKDVTKDLQQLDRWSVGLLGHAILTMPHDKRFDYELKITDDGLRVVQRDLDEGKIG